MTAISLAPGAGEAAAMALEVNRPDSLPGADAKTRLGGLVKAAIRRPLAHASDAVRLSAFLVLNPAAQLPKRWAYAAADAIGFLYSLSPIGARVRRTMRAAFPDRDAAKLAREWLSRPFRDHVCVTRIVAGREAVWNWPVESRNEPAILRELGRSCIVATGHFSRQAVAVTYLARIAPKKLAAVLANLDQRSLSPRALRLRVQFGEMLKAVKVLRDGDVEIIQTGRRGVVTRLVNHLKGPNAVAILASDSVSAKGREKGHARPFAGHAMVSFALGTARLARLSQRPIVVCVPFLHEDGHIVLEWSAPIQAPARDDEDADARLTSAVLDILERAVGERPGQYVLPIGEERRWSETERRWVKPARAGAGRGECPMAEHVLESS